MLVPYLAQLPSPRRHHAGRPTCMTGLRHIDSLKSCSATVCSISDPHSAGITLDNLYDWDQETNQLMEGEG